jgi:hypothetical protein
VEERIGVADIAFVGVGDRRTEGRRRCKRGCMSVRDVSLEWCAYRGLNDRTRTQRTMLVAGIEVGRIAVGRIEAVAGRSILERT